MPILEFVIISNTFPEYFTYAGICAFFIRKESKRRSSFPLVTSNPYEVQGFENYRKKGTVNAPASRAAVRRRHSRLQENISIYPV
jgi:hypothetical protein